MKLESSQLARGAGYVLHQVPPKLDAIGFVESWAKGIPWAEDLRERKPSAFRAVERGILLRRLFEIGAQDELGRTPVTAVEEARAEEKNWQLVAQPRAVRAAEVLLPVKFFESNEVALAKLVQIRAAAATALSVEDLSRKVQASALEVKANVSARKLPPLAADGRVVVKSAEDDPSVVLSASRLVAVASLQKVGEVSEVVGSTGAYHFFYALEIWPEAALNDEARRKALQPLIAADRMAASLSALRSSLRAGTKIERSPKTPALLERIGRID